MNSFHRRRHAATVRCYKGSVILAHPARSAVGLVSNEADGLAFAPLLACIEAVRKTHGVVGVPLLETTLPALGEHSKQSLEVA